METVIVQGLSYVKENKITDIYLFAQHNKPYKPISATHVFPNVH